MNRRTVGRSTPYLLVMTIGIEGGLAAAAGGAVPDWAWPVLIVAGVVAVGVAFLLWRGSRPPDDD